MRYSWKWFIVIYVQLYCHTNKISQFWSICLWFSRKTNANRNLIGYWTTKERIWYDSKSPVFPHLSLYLARVISLSGHLPGSIFCKEGDIASTQNLLICFKPIIYKLSYSHAIINNNLHIRIHPTCILMRGVMLPAGHSIKIKGNKMYQIFFII